MMKIAPIFLLIVVFASASATADAQQLPPRGTTVLTIRACVDDHNVLSIVGRKAIWHRLGGTAVGVAVPNHNDCRGTATQTVFTEWNYLGPQEVSWVPSYNGDYSFIFTGLPKAISTKNVSIAITKNEGRNAVTLLPPCLTKNHDIQVEYVDPQLEASWYTVTLTISPGLPGNVDTCKPIKSNN